MQASTGAIKWYLGEGGKEGDWNNALQRKREGVALREGGESIKYPLAESTPSARENKRKVTMSLAKKSAGSCETEFWSPRKHETHSPQMLVF